MKNSDMKTTITKTLLVFIAYSDLFTKTRAGTSHGGRGAWLRLGFETFGRTPDSSSSSDFGNIRSTPLEAVRETMVLRVHVQLLIPSTLTKLKQTSK